MSGGVVRSVCFYLNHISSISPVNSDVNEFVPGIVYHLPFSVESGFLPLS